MKAPTKKLRTPAEIERQKAEEQKMLDAIAAFSGTVTQIPEGARITKAPKENVNSRPKEASGYDADQMDYLEQKYLGNAA